MTVTSGNSGGFVGGGDGDSDDGGVCDRRRAGGGVVDRRRLDDVGRLERLGAGFALQKRLGEHLVVLFQ